MKRVKQDTYLNPIKILIGNEIIKLPLNGTLPFFTGLSDLQFGYFRICWLACFVNSWLINIALTCVNMIVQILGKRVLVPFKRGMYDFIDYVSNMGTYEI